MRKTKFQSVSEQSKTTNSQGLMKHLGCGRATAEKIAKSAGGRIQVGTRILYNLTLIDAYLDSISGE